MSLWPVFTKENCIPYTPWDGVTHLVMNNLYLITPPCHYEESISRLSHWFYDPGQDRLVLVVWEDIIHWPGWAVYRYDFSAETGDFIAKKSLGWGPGNYVNYASLGSYGAIYATWDNGSQVTEISATSVWPKTGMWTINPGTWNPSAYFSHVIVNREDNLIVGRKTSQKIISIWDISGTPTIRGTLQLPENLGYMTYESREICWIITNNGLLGKINYYRNPPRWEILSSVQNPVGDAKGYMVAFDSKRNRLAVFRWRPDAEDGACRSQIEFYRPLYLVAGLTDPVPVTKLRTGEKVHFVAHLYGSNGEGVATYPVQGALTEPAAGALLTPITSAVQSGAATLRYQAPEVGAIETLSLSATVED